MATDAATAATETGEAGAAEPAGAPDAGLAPVASAPVKPARAGRIETAGAVVGGAVGGTLAAVAFFKLAGSALVGGALGLWALPALGLLAIVGYLMARKLNKGESRRFSATILTAIMGLFVPVPGGGSHAAMTAAASAAIHAHPILLGIGFFGMVAGGMGIGMEVGRWAGRSLSRRRPKVQAQPANPA